MGSRFVPVVGAVAIGLLAMPVTSLAQVADRNCDDFVYQEDAQEFFISQGGPARDPHRLDADRDGIACESLPRRPAAGAGGITTTARPARLPDTGVNALVEWSFLGGLGATLGGLLILAASGVARRSRRM